MLCRPRRCRCKRRPSSTSRDTIQKSVRFLEPKNRKQCGSNNDRDASRENNQHPIDAITSHERYVFQIAAQFLSLIPIGGNREPRHKAERNRNDQKVRAKHPGRAARSAATSSRFILKRGHDSFQANDIVSKQPAIITRQVQSRIVSLPKSCNFGLEIDTQTSPKSRGLSATIRHGFDMIPLNSRRPPIAWPKSPT